MMTEESFRILSFLVLLVFYGAYVLKMLLQRRKGIRTDQMGRGKQGKEKRIELGLKFITYVTPLLEVFSILREWTMLPVVFRFFGIVVALLGDVVFVISVISMRDSWRAGVNEEEKTELVTEGIYSFSRNPAFLGFDLVYI
ncbi:MAG: hypothetical protein KBS81_10130, partial [Spirochaetales bacterium]|nr:hypothetical protein [Candidatus Physcosoma equi]